MDPIYAIREASGCIRYIGVTQQLLEQRLRDHLSEARTSKKRSHKLNWLRSLDYVPAIEVIEWVLPSYRVEREMYWIALFRDYGHKLVNGTAGGDGIRGLSAESRERIGAAHRNKVVSLETRVKMSAAQKKKAPPSLETRAKISWALKNKGPRSLETLKKISAAQTGEKHHAFGKKQSSELIEKRAAANRGGNRSLETRARMSVAARIREAAKRKIL